MENSRNPMWFTWLSGFVVLFLVSSSVWSPTKPVDQAPVGDATPHQVHEPRLPLKNYSIPRFTINASANQSGEASRAEDAAPAVAALPVASVEYVFLPIEAEQNATSAAAVVVEGVAAWELPLAVSENNEESDEALETLTTCALDWQRFALSVPSLTISMGGNGFVGDADVATPAAIEEEPLEVGDDATVAVEERPETAAAETPEAEAPLVLSAAAAAEAEAVDAGVPSVPLMVAPSVGVEVEAPEALATAVAADEDETATAVPTVTIDNAVDVLDAVVTVEADAVIDADRDVPVIQAVSTPILFPANMNIAEANTGARVVAKESTKRCVKSKKWNPLQCHRPLKTVNSHFPIASALDCFAFYLEHDDASRASVPKNSLTVELFQPAKAIYGFGLSHFLADAGHEDARFNASCAPRDISFTVYENIPAPPSSTSSSSGGPVAAASQPKQFRFPFTWEGIKHQIQRDADSIVSMTKASTATRRFLPSVEIPTTFDGIVFDPLGSHVAQTMQTPAESRGATVTEFFPLSTTFFPQYVHKVSLHVHSTQSGGDLACVYRVQVYGDFDAEA